MLYSLEFKKVVENYHFVQGVLFLVLNDCI